MQQLLAAAQLMSRPVQDPPSHLKLLVPSAMLTLAMTHVSGAAHLVQIATARATCLLPAVALPHMRTGMALLAQTDRAKVVSIPFLLTC